MVRANFTTVYSYEADVVQHLQRASSRSKKSFNIMFRFFDDVISLNNLNSNDHIDVIYLNELEINDTIDAQKLAN